MYSFLWYVKWCLHVCHSLHTAQAHCFPHVNTTDTYNNNNNNNDSVYGAVIMT